MGRNLYELHHFIINLSTVQALELTIPQNVPIQAIEKGTSPADRPVEQPMKFNFVLNLRSARPLGVTIPQHLLVQATAVIR